MITIKIYFGKSVCAAVFVATFMGYGTEIFITYTVVLFHELAHLWACFVLGIKPIYIKISIFGMNLVTEYCSDPDRRIAIYAAGPIVSFFMFIVFLILSYFFTSYTTAYIQNANLCICLINILPVYPLDGANILKSILCRFTGILNANKIIRHISIMVSAILLCINFTVFYAGYLNISVLIILIFLIYSVLNEHIYNVFDTKQVLCGNMNSGKVLKRISCSGEKKLVDTAELISPYYNLSVSVFMRERFFGEITQKEIIYFIKKYGAFASLKYCIEKREKMLYNIKTECRK